MDLNIDDFHSELLYLGPAEEDSVTYHEMGFSQPFRELQKYGHS